MGELPLKIFHWTTLLDPLEPFTTGSLPASQFNASQLPFVDFGDVPKTEFERYKFDAPKPTLADPRPPSGQSA